MHVFTPASAPTDWTNRVKVSRSAKYRRRLFFATCLSGSVATILACHDLDPDLSDLLDPHGGSDQSSVNTSWTHDDSVSQASDWPDTWPSDAGSEPHGSGVDSSAAASNSGNDTLWPTTSNTASESDDSSSPALAELVLVEVLADPEGKDGAAEQPEFLEWVVVGAGDVEVGRLDLTVTGWPRLQGIALGLANERLRADQTLVIERYERAEFMPNPPVRRTEHGLRVAFAHHAALRNQGGAVAIYGVDGKITDGLVYGDGEQAPADLLAKWQAAPVEKASPGFSLTRSQPLPMGLAPQGWIALSPTLGIYTATTSEGTSSDDGTTTATGSSATTDVADSSEERESSATGETFDDSDATGATSDQTSDHPLVEPAPMMLTQVLVDPLGADGSVEGPEWLELTHAGEESTALGDFAIWAGTWPQLDTRSQGWADLEWQPGDRLKIQRFSQAADLPDSVIQRVGKRWVLSFAHAGTLRNLGGALGIVSHNDEVLDGLIYGDGQAALQSLQERWGDQPNLAKPAQGQALCRHASAPMGVVPTRWELCEASTNE